MTVVLVAQDRSVVISEFRGKLKEANDQGLSLAAVFDGHKRAEAAVIASDMLPTLLAECALVSGASSIDVWYCG